MPIASRALHTTTRRTRRSATCAATRWSFISAGRQITAASYAASTGVARAPLGQRHRLLARPPSGLQQPELDEVGAAHHADERALCVEDRQPRDLARLHRACDLLDRRIDVRDLEVAVHVRDDGLIEVN